VYIPHAGKFAVLWQAAITYGGEVGRRQLSKHLQLGVSFGNLLIYCTKIQRDS
jgi:hypothetical protein